MPKGMFLKSTWEASSFSAPGEGMLITDYCSGTGFSEVGDFSPVPIDLFVNYGLGFQQRYVKQVERSMVHAIAPASDGFRVSVGDETMLATTVVVATGHVRYANTPEALRGEDLKAYVSHPSEHDDFSRLAGRSVAVIGAGQSALESAALLREAGAEVHLLVRDASILWGGPPAEHVSALRRMVKPPSGLGPGWSHFVLSRAPNLVTYLPPALRLFLVRTVLGPSGAWWLRQRVENAVEVFLDTTVVGGKPVNGKVRLDLQKSDGSRSSLDVDHVLAATGYDVDVDALEFLDPALRSGTRRVRGSRAPLLSTTFESSVPGLYFSGLSAAATFGPVMRFVCGTDFTAPRIARSIIRTNGAAGSA